MAFTDQVAHRRDQWGTDSGTANGAHGLRRGRVLVSAWVRVAAAQSDAYVFALQDKGNELILGINGLHAYARLTGAGGLADE